MTVIGVPRRSPFVLGVPVQLPRPEEIPDDEDWPDYQVIDVDADPFGADAPLNAAARGAASPADINAAAVVDRVGTAMGLSKQEKQYAMTVARGEGHYGLGWKAGEGAGSHNWGAVQGTGSAGSFVHKDTHADGTVYTTNFKAYKSDDDGFADMAKILLKPNVRAALAKGSLRDAVFTQHSNGYFELDPEKYLAAVTRNYNALVDGLGWTRFLSEHGKSSLVAGVVAALAAAGGFYAYKKFR